MTDSGAVQPQTWILTGDRIVLYLTRVKAFAGSMVLTSDMFESREKVWPGKPGAADPYPWRFEARPEIALDEDEWLPAERLVGRLEHAAKWPAEHWTLAFQGQLRTVSDHDAALLLEAMEAQRAKAVG